MRVLTVKWTRHKGKWQERKKTLSVRWIFHVGPIRCLVEVTGVMWGGVSSDRPGGLKGYLGCLFFPSEESLPAGHRAACLVNGLWQHGHPHRARREMVNKAFKDPIIQNPWTEKEMCNYHSCDFLFKNIYIKKVLPPFKERL